MKRHLTLKAKFSTLVASHYLSAYLEENCYY